MRHNENPVKLDLDWKLVALFSCGFVYALIMTMLGIDAPVPRTPIWVLMLGCFAMVIYLWKSFRFYEDGFVCSRCVFFRRKVQWNQVQQIVHVTLGKGKRRRGVTIIVLHTAPNWPGLENHAAADGYILPNLGHIFLLDRKDWETKKSVLALIADNWGEIR